MDRENANTRHREHKNEAPVIGGQVIWIYWIIPSPYKVKK